MSKSCKECGHPLDDNAQECPVCGCPVEKESTSAVVDTDLLNEGKNTKAESTMKNYAELILIWGNILAYVAFALSIVVGIVGACMVDNDIAAFVFLYNLVIAFILLFVIKFIAKIYWATIMLFVNISTTLKRIELKLEENGTH